MTEFINPDASPSIKFKFDTDMQRCILSMLLRDREFLVQSKALIKPQFFSNKAHELISKILFDYYNKYIAIPSVIQIAQELKNIISDEKNLQFYQVELRTVMNNYYFPGLENRDAFLDKVSTFAKIQALKEAYAKSLDLVKEKPEDDATWMKIDELYKHARSIDRCFNEGLVYFDSLQDRYLKNDEGDQIQEEKFTTNFRRIDDALDGGLSRGEIGVWMALPGVGKSLALASTAVANLKDGKTVMYISCEMSQEKTARRIDAQLANMNIRDLQKNSEIVVKTILDLPFYKEAEDKKKLIIKKFAAGTLDMPMLRAYYSQTKMRGFKPDVLIVDYVGEMKDYPGIPTHESKERLLRDLKGFGEEEGHVTFSAIQPNIRAKEQERDGMVLDELAQGGSFGQQRPLDAFWSITQNTAEKEANVARGFVIKHREGESKFQFYIGFDFKGGTLRIREISENEYHARKNSIIEKRSDFNEKLIDKDLKLSKINTDEEVCFEEPII